jgi:hypothetical protein
MNKTLKSILITSAISVLTVLSILYLYKEFIGIDESPKNDTMQVEQEDSTTKLSNNSIELALLLEQQRCLEELLMNEQAGRAFTNTCGSTSGKIGIGVRYKEIESQIKAIRNEIDSISNLILQEKTQLP